MHRESQAFVTFMRVVGSATRVQIMMPFSTGYITVQEGIELIPLYVKLCPEIRQSNAAFSNQ